MIFIENSGVSGSYNAVARDAVMPWPLYVAGPLAKAAHPSVATHLAIPAITRRAAAATVASVNRGTI